VSGKGLSKDEAERIIGALLLDRILQLDFGYTSYTVNCYLKAGRNAAALQQVHHFISLGFWDLSFVQLDFGYTLYSGNCS